MTRNRQECLETEVARYKEQVSSLQDRLDSVTKEFDMSVEDLSETLLQIKVCTGFRRADAMNGSGALTDCLASLCRLLGCSRRAGRGSLFSPLTTGWRTQRGTWPPFERPTLKPCWNYRKPDSCSCWSTTSVRTCRYTKWVPPVVSCWNSTQSTLVSQGRVEDGDAEDGEGEGGEPEDAGSERQTLVKKSSSPQHFARYRHRMFSRSQASVFHLLVFAAFDQK